MSIKEIMDDNESSRLMGAIKMNLLGLETLLRSFLLKYSGDTATYKLFDLEDGDEISEDEFTNFDTLRQLISKYNQRIPNQKYMLDKTNILLLRDALAHGRALSKETNTPFWLIKFSSSKYGKVEVEYFEEMSIHWFHKNVQFIADAIDKVEKAIAQI